MEPARLMLAHAGKEYKDNRLSNPAEASGLAANLGRMPVIGTDAGSIGQSAAIYFYVATVTGLAGKTPFETAKCLEVLEHTKETMTAFRSVVPYGTTPSEEQLNKWFDSGATDSEGVAQGRGERFFPWWLGRIEASLTGTDGYAVGSSLSFADIVLFTTLQDHLTEEESDKPEEARYPFNSKDRVAKALEKCPKIKASIAHVLASEGVKKHLATRGKQMF